MFKPVMDRIIVRLDEEKNSPIITENNFSTQNRGVVESVGPEVSLVTTGDHIIFHQFDELPLPEKGLVVIREKSLLGIL